MGLVSNYQEIAKKWAYIKKHYKDIISEAAQEHSREIADFNREQLMQGKDSEGKKLKPYRNKQYADLKHRMNPLPGPGTPDFKLTGETHRELFASVDENRYQIVFGSAAPLNKVASLVGRDGDKIFGLTGDNRHRVWIEVLRNPVVEKVKNILQNKIN